MPYNMKYYDTEEINGKYIYYAFLAGGTQVLRNQVMINDLNVFPVQDNDTGTNLASTIRSVIDNVRPSKSYKITIGDIADAAIAGARGNSGVIFAQFLYGLSSVTLNKPAINFKEFAESIKQTIPFIYEAIDKPVEGTILTVIKDWSDFIYSRKENLNGFKNVIIESFSVLEKSLKETTSKLRILNKHGVVDAGAKGFVLFIEGIISFLKTGNIRKVAAQSVENVLRVHSNLKAENDINFRYCTEAVIKDLSISKAGLQKILRENGDSIVMAGAENNIRIHLHTNHPADLFYKLKDYGTITFQKVDDMVRQQEILTNRKWNIALVTDSACDLPKEIIEYYQINVVPLNLSFGDNQYLDKLTVNAEQFYDLLETQPEFPKTSQVNEYTFTNLYSQLAARYDAVIAVHLTSEFSGTFANSWRAAKQIQKEFNKPVHVIDSKNLSGALGLIVLKAAMDIEKGESVENILTSINSGIENAGIYVSVRNLDYMIKGGRVSKPKGFIAELFGINPIVSMGKDGKSVLFGNTFSQKASLNKIYSHVKNLSLTRPVWNYIVLHANNQPGAEKVEERMIEIAGKKPVSVVNISSVIGMHAGLGALAVSVLFDN